MLIQDADPIQVFKNVEPFYDAMRDESADGYAKAYVSATFATLAIITGYSASFWRVRFMQWKYEGKEQN